MILVGLWLLIKLFTAVVHSIRLVRCVGFGVGGFSFSSAYLVSHNFTVKLKIISLFLYWAFRLPEMLLKSCVFI